MIFVLIILRKSCRSHGSNCLAVPQDFPARPGLQEHKRRVGLSVPSTAAHGGGTCLAEVDMHMSTHRLILTLKGPTLPRLTATLSKCLGKRSSTHGAVISVWKISLQISWWSLMWQRLHLHTLSSGLVRKATQPLPGLSPKGE